MIKPDGRFIFSTLDRADLLYRSVFRDPDNFEHNIERNPNLLEKGDRHFETRHGTTFMHVPTRDDIVRDLKATGWFLCEDQMRSELSDESSSVREFSEDCRFWVVKKTATERRRFLIKSDPGSILSIENVRGRKAIGVGLGRVDRGVVGLLGILSPFPGDDFRHCHLSTCSGSRFHFGNGCFTSFFPSGRYVFSTFFLGFPER